MAGRFEKVFDLVCICLLLQWRVLIGTNDILTLYALDNYRYTNCIHVPIIIYCEATQYHFILGLSGE